MPLSQETIATGTRNGQPVAWHIAAPSAFALCFNWLRRIGGNDEDGTHQFEPTVVGIASYVGASGGPIFGYAPGAIARDYSLFALQSAQRLAGTRQQAPESLVATDGRRAINMAGLWAMDLDVQASN